jgi:outer membrane protein insertion porin family
VIEVDPLYPVRFEGIDRPAAEIEAYLRRKDPFFGSKIPATEAVLRRHAAAIKELLGGNPEIAGRVTADGANQLAVVFGPASGPPRVAEVRFEGNSVIPTQALLNNFAGVAYGTVYSETAFRRLLDAGIRPLYEKRGRIKVAFPSIKVEKAREVDGLVVTVAVDEGASYDLGEVRILGETPVPAKELLRAGGFKAGDLADFERIDAGMEQVRKRLRREGFIKAALKVERRLNDEKKTVDLEVTPELGDRYTFSRLAIRGLDIHGEAAVRKIWAIKEGAPFNGEYPDYFLSQIRQQGLFDALGETRSEIAIDEANKTAAVTLVFRPASTAPGAGSRATSGRPFP